MSNGLARESLRKQTKNILQRVDELEGNIGQLVQGIQQAFGQFDQRLGATSEIVDALVEIVGSEVVNQKIQETRDAKALEASVKAKEALDKAVADGKYAAATVIGKDSVIAGAESDKDGNVLKPGYVQLAYAAIKPEFQEKIVGQGVGFKFDTDEGGSFVVNGIFDPVPPKAEEKAPEAPIAE